MFSVRACEGSHKGKVIAYSNTLLLTDVTYRVSQVGRQRVLATKVKNVHAGCIGTIISIVSPIMRFQTDLPISSELICLGGTSITYNPYKYDTFVELTTEKRVLNSKHAFLFNNRIYGFGIGKLS
jgi:hypothetical protein